MGCEKTARMGGDLRAGAAQQADYVDLYRLGRAGFDRRANAWRYSSGRTQEEQHGAIARLPADIAFLARHGISVERLRLVAQTAADSRTAASHEIMATGFGLRRYWSLLAKDLGLPFIDDLSAAKIVANAGLLTVDAVRSASCVMVRRGITTFLVLAPQPHQIPLLRRRLAETPALAARLRIATPETIRAFLVANRHAALSRYAIGRLARVQPSLSASRIGKGARGRMLLVAAALGLTQLAPLIALEAMALGAWLFFVNCSIWRLAAAFHRARPPRVEPVADPELPTYTVLVPLYREAAVVPDLIAHMKRIDYPATKLQVLVIVEDDDDATRKAVARYVGAPPIEMISVPPAGPRTKPKALTYALAFARGDYVVVFDAEDRPEPDQLRKAAAAFRERPDLGCVQARLTPDNQGTWFARMFTLEYAANFDVLLPALADWRVPLPLGGTSNHFPRALLEKVAAWDPYNVTEDADLGVRLARFGYHCATLPSRTYEEAPVTFRQWLPQRRRWIKGWMQTIAVCLSKEIPSGLRLRLKDQLVVHAILSAGVLGLLLYPVSWALLAIAIANGLGGIWPSGPYLWVFLALGFGNFAAVIIAAATSAARGLNATGALRLAWHIPLLPVYWALMSIAAWQALFQLFRRPSEWEKTSHGVARDRCSRRVASRL